MTAAIRTPLFGLFGVLLALACSRGESGSERVAARERAPTGERVSAVAPAPAEASLEGLVRDRHGPVAGAMVRVGERRHVVRADERGRFRASVLAGKAVTVSAWSPRHFIARAGQHLPGSSLTVNLEPLDRDNPSYRWIAARGDDLESCASCHSDAANPDLRLTFDDWARSSHARSAQNPRFLSLYLGTDVHGRASARPRRLGSGSGGGYGGTTVPPEAQGPYYGPGFRLDWPDNPGNCGACHVPAGGEPHRVDPTRLDVAGAEGVGCDYCHKVWDVRLDPRTRLPHANTPGALSFVFRRPPPGHQFFSAARPRAEAAATLVPVQSRSEVCAPCHHGHVSGTLIYDSYGEWLRSPWADRRRGKTCQDCHMPARGGRAFARADRGGGERDPRTVLSHELAGIDDPALMRAALRLEISARRAGEVIHLEVAATNVFGGHAVPTDSPLRHVILVVQARGRQGHWLPLASGPVLPAWAGEGNPAAGYLAGQPGKIFAKVFESVRTGVAPTVEFWSPIRLVSDNRLAPFVTDRSSYAFRAAPGPVEVEVRLLLRPAPRALVDQKGWDAPDRLMARRTVAVR